MVIYGIVECDSEIREDRINYDKTKVKELCDVCKVAVEDEHIGKVVRLGKFDKNKPKRPMLVNFKSKEVKKHIFSREQDTLETA